MRFLISPVLALFLSTLVAGCGATDRVLGEHSVWSVEIDPEGMVAVLDVELTLEGRLVPLRGRSEPMASLPIEVHLEQDAIVCSRVVEGRAIHLLVFERRGDERAYGVYGLWRAKNHLPVDYPLSGEPIAWDDRDSGQALAYLLEREGVSPTVAAKLAASSNWMACGLRVFFTVPREAAGALLADSAARVLVIRVEIPIPV